MSEKIRITQSGKSLGRDIALSDRFSVSPKVSVVIPAYNIAPYIAESLESVFAQTFRDFEVVIVNDGSSDTVELERAIAPFRDKIIYIEKPNGGAASARNLGVKTARGELIAFLDGDDIWLPEFLASQIKFLEANDFDMVYADAQFFGEGIKDFQTYMQFSKSNGAVTTESLISWECNVITSGTVVSRDKIVKAGMFDESETWRRGQDFEMWFRLLKNGARVGYQREVLLKYRVRQGSLSGNPVQVAERNINALNGIKAKFELNQNEMAALERQLKISQAMWQIENGKAQILNGEFGAARESFAAANRHYRKLKLSFVGLMLKFAPRTLRRIFSRRADAF
ncbi:MAG TPA: glycosyltransferase family 2 protein [Pyrinomonadaceae bacterium]|nr:glycosyltransferase family 2 protein [Pyrinomonadaceae bacterium]